MNGIDESLAHATSHIGIDDEEEDRHRPMATVSPMMESKDRAIDFAAPTSSIIGDKRIWDITAKFRHVASIRLRAISLALPVGTLVKDESFTLFESVGALEIMDPKMDSGCLAPGEALVDAYDLERSLLPEEVIGIIDQFLCCEMAWHQGYPLAQTLFSSHYIDRLLSLEAKTIDQIHFTKSGKNNIWCAPLVHVVLRAYCIAVIKCCDYALEEINRSLDGGGTRCNFYEEEDFSGHTYGRELFTRVPLEPILNLLSTAVEFVKAEKSYSIKGQRLASPDLYEAIETRIKFRVLLMRAMSVEEDIDDKRAFWKSIPQLLSNLKETHNLGQPVKESFSPKIQRRLASTVPPKPMVELSFVDASTKLEQMCKDCEEAVKIVRFGPDNVQALKAFLWSFSSRKPEPCTYPRACLTAPLFTCDDAGFEQLLRKDLEDIVLAGSEVLDPTNWTVEAPRLTTTAPNRKFEMAQAINLFTEMAVRIPGGYIDYFRTLTSNRCRVRRNLTHVAAALEDLQMRETEVVDESLHKLDTNDMQFPLSSWTFLEKLRVMEWIIQLGFELDMYLPDELAGMYWYLAMLSSSRLSLLELILPITEGRATKLNTSSPVDRIKAKQFDQSIALLRSMKAEAHGITTLASALSMVYILLSYLGLITQTGSHSSFHKLELKYELRMKPFLTIKSPELPSFDDWNAAIHPFGPYTGSGSTLESVWSTSMDKIEQDIKQAKAQYAVVKKLGASAAGCVGLEDEWTKNTSVLLQTCIATGIALSSLKTHKNDRSLKVEIPPPGNDRYHDWWVVPKLTRIE